ncbi:Large neutral amino acids transporter small subunit 1 [Holothuria leucospilota]|uniref:Large neutral amino acids transporter small subunit 1 n=1 Tax=Holothuria leucospilota TaxID=206669 RepID=A0A9Q1CC88_HOLLE|nr:Large neutral amino acids transporter small subunit 1 [Holothuria leucospilota]
MADKADNPQATRTKNDDLVNLKPKISLFNGVTIIVGVIIGSGIFISPGLVLEQTQSVGSAMLVWIFCGVFSMVGALCYGELGTMITMSGGDYAYIYKSFGELPAFLLLWVTVIVIRPTAQAVVALTFGNYLLQPFFQDCENAPVVPAKILAALCITILTFVNCLNVKWAARIQDVFTVAKVLALVIIILVGFYNLIFRGRTESFQNMFDGTTGNVGNYALAIYGGLFAYGGWNYLNFVTEELKDPYVNLPRAIVISVPLVTAIYVLANLAYFVAMSPAELLASNAVAVTFGLNLLGVLAFIMPVSVALSTFGSVNGLLLTGSRLYFVGARMGQLPEAIAMINVQRKTPILSLVFTCFLSLLYLLARDIGQLINYFSFVQWSATGAAILGLLWLRYSKPDMPRPVKVNIILPIAFLFASIFLVVMGIVAAPWDTGIGILIFLSGIPVYIIFIWWNKFPDTVNKGQQSATMWLQKLFVMVAEEKEE